MMMLLLAAVEREMTMIDTGGMTEGDLLLARGFHVLVADVVQTQKVFDVRRRRRRGRRSGRRLQKRKTLNRLHHRGQKEHETNKPMTSFDSFQRKNQRFHF